MSNLPSQIAPMPFVVGAARSGNTLLRLMLDSHPELAIPPGTHFLSKLQGSGPNADTAETFIGKLVTSQYWSDYRINWETFARNVVAVQLFLISRAIREIKRKLQVTRPSSSVT